MLTIAILKAMADCEFDRLFTRSVPHILERIFFSLDHDSFEACQKVCKAWNELHSSEPYLQKAEELLEEKRYNENLLWQYSCAGNAKEVGNLLASGVNVNGVPKGMTPLYSAAINGHNNVVKILLEAGADPNREDEDRKNALYWPALNGNTVMVKLLLDAGASPNEYGRTGRTPLHVAASNGNTETVKTLLDAGADPNREDIDGNNSLCWPVRYGNTDIVKMLLKAGADPTMRNKWGRSPLDMNANTTDEMAKLLFKHRKKQQRVSKRKIM